MASPERDVHMTPDPNANSTTASTANRGSGVVGSSSATASAGPSGSPNASGSTSENTGKPRIQQLCKRPDYPAVRNQTVMPLAKDGFQAAIDGSTCGGGSGSTGGDGPDQWRAEREPEQSTPHVLSALTLPIADRFGAAPDRAAGNATASAEN
jgi:hypothetical protein